MAKANSNTTRKREKHGLTHTAEYRAWGAMRRRCNSPSCDFYYLYGARGISICPEWDSFPQFLADVGHRPGREYSIGRIDNALGYFPGNVRWETKHQQNSNTRRTHFITYNGKTQCRSEWAREYGIDPNILMHRLKVGWSVEEALTLPAYAKNPRYKLVSHLGKNQTVSAWAREYGFKPYLLLYRLNHGWGIEKALTTPIRDWGPNRKRVP